MATTLPFFILNQTFLYKQKQTVLTLKLIHSSHYGVCN